MTTQIEKAIAASAACEHCGIFTRNPCSDVIAKSCPNNLDKSGSFPGGPPEFNPKEVAAKLRSYAMDVEDDDLYKAAKLIEERM